MSVDSGVYTVIGVGIAYLGVVTSQLWTSRSTSKRTKADREAAAADARAARLAAVADRRTDLELAALADVRTTLDEMAQTLSSHQAGVITGTRDAAEKLECVAKVQTLGERA